MRRVCFLALAGLLSCTRADHAQNVPLAVQTTAVWEASPPSAAPMIVESTPVYAAATRQLIAFGGRDRNFDYVGGTWAYDRDSRAWVDLKPAVSPPPRSNHALVYDGSRGTLLLFGGNGPQRAYNDLWEYDLAQHTWTQLATANPPEARQMHGMVYDAANQVVLVFGGRRRDGGAAFADTWAYDRVANSWRLLQPEQAPPIQDHANLAYDVKNEVAVLFSGPDSDTGVGTSTWAYDYRANSWTRLNTDIGPTSDHCGFAYRTGTGRFTLFGNSAEGDAMETWLFDYALRDWTRLAVPQAPPYREHFGLAYDPARDIFVLVGGFPNSDNWVLHLGQ